MDQPTLDDALRTSENLRDQLIDARYERLSDARRRAQLYVDELLTCAVTIASLEGSGPGTEIDIANDLLRSRAEEVGLLRHQPPRPVT